MSDFIVENGVLTQYIGKGGVVIVPKEVKAIDPHAFDECMGLEKLLLNEGLECYDEACISSIIKKDIQLPCILIPSTVKEIKLADQFGVLDGKVNYLIHEENPHYFMDDDICYEVNEQGQYTVLFCQNKMLGHAIINNGTVEIADCAFASSQRKSDDSFDEEDFDYDCDCVYDDGTAASFVRLQKIELPDSLEKIGANAFSECVALSEIFIGPSVSTIDATAFFGCKKLKKITVSPENPYYTDVDGVLFDKSVKILVIYPEGKKADRYELPATVEIFGRAFANVEGIASLHLSANITKLVRNAFPDRCKIEKLYIKNDIKDIDPLAFGEADYCPAARDEPIEVYLVSNYYFNDYVQEVMKSPAGDVLVITEKDTPETLKIKKQFTFKKVKDGLCITHFFDRSHGEESSSTLTVPAMLGDQPIVELGVNVFDTLTYKNGIETIIISEGIKRIDQAALFGPSPTKIVFPASVEKIDPWAFADANKEYKDFCLPDSELVFIVEPDTYAAEFITSYQFDTKSSPRIIIRDDGVDYLKMVLDGDGYTAVLQKGSEPTDRVIVPNMYRDKPVKKVILCEGPYGEISRRIVALSIPKNVEEIVGLDQYRPTHQTEDYLPNIQVAEENQHFWSDGIALYSRDQKTLLQLIDYSVEVYRLPDATETVSDYAFCDCRTIKKVTLSQNTRVLGAGAFVRCGALAKIAGAEHLQEVGQEAFSNTPYEKGAEYVLAGQVLIKYNGNQSIAKVPEGVAVIADRAFDEGYRYEEGEDPLEEIVLPSSVKKICYNAFGGRKTLKKIHIPEGVISIGSNVFDACCALESLHIPSTVTDLSLDAFENHCYKKRSVLSEITVSDDNPNYCAVNNVLYDKAMSEIIFIPANADICELVIPATVKKINGVSDCRNIRKIVIAGSIDEWEDTFSGCKNLVEVVFSGECQEIGDCAFSDCEKLGKITLSNTVERIGKEAFAGTAVKKVSLPKSVRTLGWGAFSGVPEIEVYDTIDPEAKDANKGIDTSDGYPNSLVGYVGIGPAHAMWDCAANHTWVNYTIAVRSAETDEIKYKVWMGAVPSQRAYYCFLSSAWGHNATFAFTRLDEFFPKIRGAEHKLQVARYRLEYPCDLSDAARKKYEAYLKKNSKEGE